MATLVTAAPGKAAKLTRFPSLWEGWELGKGQEEKLGERRKVAKILFPGEAFQEPK